MSERVALFALLLASCTTPRPPLPPAPAPIVASTTPPPGAEAFAFDPSAGLVITDDILETGLRVRRVAQANALHSAVALTFAEPLYGERRILAEIAFAALDEHIDEHTTVNVDVRAIVDHETATLVASGVSADELLNAFARALAPDALTDAQLERHIQSRIAEEAEAFGRRIGPKLLYRARYGDTHPYGWGSNTAIERMDRIDAAAVRAYLAGHVRPERGRLAIVATAKTLEPLPSDLAFGAWRNDNPPMPPAPIPELTPDTTDPGKTFHVLGAASERQSTVMLLHTGPPPGHADFDAFAVLCTALGGYFGEVNRRYRHERAATYGVGTQLETRAEVSECLFGGDVDNAQVVAMFDAHRHQVETMASGDLDPALIRLAEAELWKAWARRLEHPDALSAWAARTDTFDARAPSAPSREALERTARRDLERAHWDVVVGTQSGPVVQKLSQNGEVVLYRFETVTQHPTP